ncbi:integral membrane protein mpv17 pmp22 family [Syncephalastrum racemosum]|uniref:Integral membrane protein mpv17 pmp22 family n=1 Tax=Syncephalastrum racemosum TaxID=13706 RepID=A0A1X2HBU3_SYNRA|nr:integral membrane protein mpv17 pmp22 family [Syncephalastrum racemosum]
MLSLYNKALSRRPILVQSLTTAFLFGTGDVIAQQAVERKGFSNHEYMRTARMAAFGGIVAGPVLSNWYRFLEQRVTGKTPFQSLIKKVATDQFLCAPIFIGVFFSAQGVFEGKSILQIKEKLQTSYVDAVIGNYKLWPMVQLVNFYFTPLYYRLMVSNLVSLGWNAYLSTLNQKTATADNADAVPLVQEKKVQQLVV